MTTPMTFLEYKHNVLNQIGCVSAAPFVTTTVTVTKKRPPKRYPSAKGYGNRQ